MISEIIPGKIYLTDEYHAATYQLVDQFNIHTFLRLDKDALFRKSWEEQTDRFLLKTVHLIDGLGNKPEAFIEAVDFLQANHGVKERIPILIYCMAGQNRSPLITALFIYSLRDKEDPKIFTFEQCMNFVKKCRPIVNTQSEIANYAREHVVPLL